MLQRAKKQIIGVKRGLKRYQYKVGEKGEIGFPHIPGKRNVIKVREIFLRSPRGGKLHLRNATSCFNRADTETISKN
jgi:hypothetical protein